MPCDLRAFKRIEWLFPIKGRWLLYLMIALLISAVVASGYVGIHFISPPPEWRQPYDIEPRLSL